MLRDNSDQISFWGKLGEKFCLKASEYSQGSQNIIYYLFIEEIDTPKC